MNHRHFSGLLLTLVLLTLLALYAHANWMTRTLRIDAHSPLIVSAVDDRSEGGLSVAELKRERERFKLLCNIRPQYQWPFCELAIRLTKDNAGVDLSAYNKLLIHLSAKGGETPSSVRLFLRNFNPAYSKEGQDSSFKPHEIVFQPGVQASQFEFKLNQFMVASWWTQAHPTSIEHLGPQLDRVVAISITTDGAVKQGQYEISLHSIEFKGAWIAADQFRLIIIFIWMFALFAYLLWAWRRSQSELQESDRQRQHLSHDNEILERRVQERTKTLAATNAQLIETLQNLEGTRHELVQIEKNSALGALVSGVAHELNTPIGNAVLVSSTLEDKLKEFEHSTETQFTRKVLKDYLQDSRRGIQILRENLKRAATLISSFKQLAADQHSEQRRQFRLAEIIDETRLAMMPIVAKTSHQLEVCCDDEIVMDSYPGALSQIFINFINNALLHGFEGQQHGEMRLNAKRITEQEIEIEFQDNGVGIPASVLSRVFEPFFTTKLGRGGSGLGMHLVHSMVTQMLGGRIDIQSELGQGTQIRLRLPSNAPDRQCRALKIGVPADVLQDFHLFLAQRPIESITHFQHPHSRRDVVELCVFLQIIERQNPKIDIELIAVDSYAAGIAQIRAGKLAALATSAWKADLEQFPFEIARSEAIIQPGQSLVGVYTRPDHETALACKRLDDLKQLRFVSNRDWSADWRALDELGVKKCEDVKTWRQMVYKVSCDEADALLAPFHAGDTDDILFENCRLVRVPHLEVELIDSRHYAASNDPQASLIIQKIFPEIQRLVQQGLFERAFRECGFLHDQ